MLYVPVAPVVALAIVAPLAFTRFTVAPDSGTGEVQPEVAQAVTVPLTLTPVTVALIVTVNGLPCTYELPVPLAEIVMVPL